MKLSQIARYWAARELTRIERPAPGQIAFQAPYTCPEFTVRVTLAGDTAARPTARLRVSAGGKEAALSPAGSVGQLTPGTFHRHDETLVTCFDLPRGASRLVLE
jgi:hypothetical protein